MSYSETAVTLVFVTQPNAGIATVTIDGTAVDQLDMYSASRAFKQQKLYTSATTGPHTVTVAVSGTKNVSSGDIYLVFDAFIVGGQTMMLNSQVGDPIGNGQQRTQTSETTIFYANVTESGGFINFNVHTPDYSSWWFLNFAAPPE